MAAPIVAAGIAAGSALLGQGAQMAATGKMNRKNRAFAEKMMHRQRDWALQDYAMQNEYNSPAAQMARLKAAGLNPNLVYGSGADAMGGQIRSTDTAKYSGETPSFNGLAGAGAAGISAYQNTQQMQIQNDLLKTQRTALEREIQLKEIAAVANTLGIITKNFKFQQDQKLAPYNLQFLKEKIGQTQQGVLESMARISNQTWAGNRDSLRLESELQTADLQRIIMRVSANKSQEEIRQIQENINNMKKTGKWQDMQNEVYEKMKRLNLSPSDPAWYKLIVAFADKLGQK